MAVDGLYVQRRRNYICRLVVSVNRQVNVELDLTNQYYQHVANQKWSTRPTEVVLSAFRQVLVSNLPVTRSEISMSQRTKHVPEQNDVLNASTCATLQTRCRHAR